METIRCIVKDERIASINVGDLGTVTTDRTLMNNWHCVMFDKTGTRPTLTTHYVEKEFKQFFEIVPQFDAEILKLQRQLSDLRDSIIGLYSSAHLKEELKSNIESQLAELVEKKRVYHAKWARTAAKKEYDPLFDANARH